MNTQPDKSQFFCPKCGWHGEDYQTITHGVSDKGEVDRGCPKCEESLLRNQYEDYYDYFPQTDIDVTAKTLNIIDKLLFA